jgi:uncharacterized protein
MFKYSLLITVFLLLSLGGTSLAQTSTALVPDGYVTDFADIIEDNTESELEKKLNTIEAKSGTEIAVITVKSLNNQKIEDFSYELGESWGIGEKGEKNGIVFLIAPNEGQARIEVGLGLKPAIPDITAFGILKKHVIPFFQDKKYDAGIIAGVRELVTSIDDPNYANQLAGISGGKLSKIHTIILLALTILSTIIVSYINRNNTYMLGTVTGLLISLIATIYSPYLWFLIPVLGIIGLITDFFFDRKYLGETYFESEATSFGNFN